MTKVNVVEFLKVIEGFLKIFTGNYILRGKKVLVKLLFPQNGPEKNFQISAPPGPGKMSTFFPFKIERQIEAHSNQEHEAKILSLSLFIERGNRFFCHRYLKLKINSLVQ